MHDYEKLDVYRTLPSGRVTTLLRVRSRARACSRPETPILPTRFHEEPFFSAGRDMRILSA